MHIKSAHREHKTVTITSTAPCIYQFSRTSKSGIYYARLDLIINDLLPFILVENREVYDHEKHSTIFLTEIMGTNKTLEKWVEQKTFAFLPKIVALVIHE